MSDLAKDPTAFLAGIRVRMKALDKLREQQQELEVRPSSDTHSMNRLREVLRDMRKLAVEVAYEYEELDEWLSKEGEAPGQWTEEKPVF